MASHVRLSLNRGPSRRDFVGLRSLLESTLEASGLKDRGRDRSWSYATFHSQAPSAASEKTGNSDNREAYSAEVKSRGVIRLDGPDVFKFLQGLVTNDVTLLQKDEHFLHSRMGDTNPSSVAGARPSALYTAILNPQGRFLFDLFLYRPTQSFEPGKRDIEGLQYLLADVDSNSIDDLLSHLKRYRLRAKVSMENISSELNVWQRFGGVAALDDSPTMNTKDEAEKTRAEAEGPSANTGKAEKISQSWHWYRDPRLVELGVRGVFPTKSIPPLASTDQKVDEEQYISWRLEHGVAEGPMEIPRGEAIPLEYNLAGLNAISFDKGCYVGQELVARTHHRGVIRKRLIPVAFVQEDGKEIQHQVVPGVEIVDPKSKGKVVGKVTTVLGSRGLAILRLDPAFKASSELKLDLPQESVYIKMTRPKWWPGAWGREDKPQEVGATA